MGVNSKPIKNKNDYVSGNNEQLCLEYILIGTPILNQHVLSENVDVVFEDIPLLIGLDFLDK